MFKNITLKRKIMLLIGVIATIIPMLLVAILSYAYYLLGVEAFFSTTVNNAVNDTVRVAELYLKEYKEKIKIDALSAAYNIEINNYVFGNDESLLQHFVDQLSNARGLAELMVFNKDHQILARNTLGLSLLFEQLPQKVMQELNNHDVVLLEDGIENRIRAAIKVSSFPEDLYILVGRYVDQEILDHLKSTQGSAEQYRILLGGLDLTKGKLESLFAFSSIFLLIISIIIARKFAYYIITPLEDLSQATVLIQEGDFSVRVSMSSYNDEIYALAKAFNLMTERIAEQRLELIKANDVIEARKRFIEVVMTAVSVGIIAIDTNHKIVLHNQYAETLLHAKFQSNNSTIESVFPEIQEIVSKIFLNNDQNQVAQLNITRSGKSLLFSLKATLVLDVSQHIESVVITFSDVTELVSNQKMAAWADIAKRIAHEIKNPLTPITIAAERLKKRYYPQIESDSESFIRYIDTIIRHVHDIEKMVSEFIDFARISAPVIVRNNIIQLLEESMLLQKAANPTIEYRFENGNENFEVECDFGHILRVMNNLLNNAADSIYSKHATNAGIANGLIIISLAPEPLNLLRIIIRDNGAGIDNGIQNQILEPYVTTKKDGTGIGLAIVNKIVEEHGGSLSIKNVDGGAEASFSLPLAK